MLRVNPIISIILISLSFGQAANTIIELGPGSSKVLKTNYRITKAAIGNPSIADIVPSEKEIIINSKTPGVTNLTIWNDKKDNSYTILVSKGTSTQYLKIYQLNNINLLETKPKWDSVERSIVKETYDSVSRMLGNCLTYEQFSISPYTSSILVYGSDSEQKRAEEVIRTIDKKTKTILFKASIYEVKLSNSFTDAFSLAYARDNIKDSAGNSAQSYSGKIGATGISYSDALREPATAIAYSKEVSLFIQKLETEGTAKLIANPQLRILENNPAVINAGERVPIISFNKDGEASTSYINTGTNLIIVGNVDSADKVYCSLRAEYSEITEWIKAVGPSGATYTSPVVANRTVANNGVSIRNNETFFLGGLIKETNTTSITKTPILGDLLGWIPLLGNLFKNETKEKLKSELVITLTPEIIYEKNSLEVK